MFLFLLAPASAQAQTGGTCTCNASVSTALCTASSIQSQPVVFPIPARIVPRNFTNVLANCVLPGSQPRALQLQAIIEAFSNTSIAVTNAATCTQAGRTQTVNIGNNPSVTLQFTCGFEAAASGAQSGVTGQASSPQPGQPGQNVVRLRNPLGEGRTNLQVIIGQVIQKVLTVLGSITLLVFIAGGVMWLTSGGSEEKVAKGSKTMLYAAIGIFVIFAAYAILNTVIKTLTGS